MTRILCFTADSDLARTVRAVADRRGWELQIRSAPPAVDEPEQLCGLVMLDDRPHTENPIKGQLAPAMMIEGWLPIRAGRLLMLDRYEEYVGRIIAFVHGASAYCRIHPWGDEPVSDLEGRIEYAMADALALPSYECRDFHVAFPGREFYRQVVESMQVPVLVITGAGRIRLMNLRALARFNYPTHMVIDQDWKMLIAPGDREALADNICAQIREGYFYECQIRFVDRQGRVFPALLTSSRIDHNKPFDRAAIVLTISDLSEIEDLQRQITMLQRIESVERAVAGMTHDFNNLLTAILGHAELLVEDIDPDSELRNSALVIRREAQKARQLTNRFVGLSGSRQFVPEPVSCNGVVEHTVDLIRPSLGDRIRIEMELLGSRDVVAGDPSLLEQALMNLCLNARDAMEGDGTLTVRTRLVEITPEECRLRHEWIPGWFVELSVQDTGCGMPPEVRERVFEPFFTTKRPGAGSGLGLPVVRGIARMHGGHVTFETEVGRGTTVRIRLPMGDRPPDESRAAGGTEAVTARGGTGGRILIVDDEQTILDYARKVLERAGYGVCTAVTEAAADEVVASPSGAPALVILDLTMPGVTTGKLIASIRQRVPSMPLILSTGFAHGGLDEALMNQVQGFLKKPYSPEQLLSQVREILHGASEDA